MKTTMKQRRERCAIHIWDGWSDGSDNTNFAEQLTCLASAG
jgi:hypothetical protein